MISIDTETTGIDLHHGAKPYLITTCDENNEQKFWEWHVDPLTRNPIVLEEDLDEFEELLEEHDWNCFHNPVFDVKAIQTVRKDLGDQWEWSRTRDTLIASHLLSTNTPHDLTSLTLEYLSVDVQPFEDRVKTATNAARTICKRYLPEWRIAAPNMPDMPSVKSGAAGTKRGTENESYWKADMWLPRAIVRLRPDLLPILDNWNAGDEPEAHPWSSVCSAYANSDTAVTLPIWQMMWEILQDRKLVKIFEERMRILPIVYQMENNGMTFNLDRLNELKDDYTEHVKTSDEILKAVADRYDYLLDIPKGPNNDSLKNFCFGYEPNFKGDGITGCHLCNKKRPKTERGLARWTDLNGRLYCSEKCLNRRTAGSWLDLPIVATSKKTGDPSTNKAAMSIYEDTLEEGTDQKEFIDALRVKRKLGKSLEYIQSYLRYNRKVGKSSRWFRLNPSLNPCGTDTLRWASHNPSQQVISKQKDHNGRNLRYIFGPLPGREWFALDYDNLELRIPAYECQEPAMLELFEHPDKGPCFGSYHLLIFSILHPDKYDAEDPDGLLRAKDENPSWYGRTKNGNFADQYGAVDTGDGNGTADRAFHVPGAQSIISQRLTEKGKLNRRYIEYAKKHGYVETLIDKAIDPDKGYPIRCKRGRWNNVVETVPLNYHVQGTACWVLMRAMIKVQELLDIWNEGFDEPQYKMIMNIHDEIVLDFPKPKGKRDTNKPKVMAVRRAMESIGEDIGVVLTCGLDRHADNWSKGLAL